MSKLESLGITRIEGIHYYVQDLDRSRAFYSGSLDFAETWRSSPELEAQGKQRSVAFSAGNITVVCSTPLGEGGRAWRFMQKHPAGVGTLIFEVADIDKTFALLEARGGTPIDDIATYTDGGGTLRQFSITTPFGDTTFRFRQRRGFTALYPGAVPVAPAADASGTVSGGNRWLCRHRSRDQQLPNHEANAAVARAGHGL